MQFPKFPKPYKQSAPRPIEGYISFMARNNSGHDVQPGELRAKNIYDTHIYLGHACIELSRGNVHTASQMLTDIQKKTEEIARRPNQRGTKYGRYAAQTILTAKMLNNFEDEGVVGPLRRQMHTDTVNHIKRIRNVIHDAPEGTRGDLSGELVEYTALGVLTRYAHPRAMAMPALRFQDESASPKHNYDMVLIETSESHLGPDQSLAQKVQVKSPCQGICEEGVQPREYRNTYSSDITLLSGCCDLDMRGSVDNPAHYTVPDMLVREVSGKATPSEISALDSITNRAFFNLTMEDERRLGKLPAADFALLS